MARTNALSINLDNDTKDQLAESYGNLLDSVQKGAISEQIKNTNYSGDPSTGSVEIDRFKNADSADYGTARGVGQGSALKNTGKVTVNVDQDKEIVEEIESKDISLFGLGDIVAKRVDNHAKRMTATLDRAFFKVAEDEGTDVELPLGVTDIQDVAEAAIQAVETATNDWVDGVDRDQIVMTLTPSAYGKLRNYIDKVSAPTADSGTADVEMFHGVRVFSNHRQSSDILVQIEGAIAQPVMVNEYDAEKINLSNAYGLELFYSYGTKAIMPDLIKKVDKVPQETS